MTDAPILRHKIGCTRTLETAVLCIAYLRERRIGNHNIRFVCTQPTDANGYWSTDIIVDAQEMTDRQSHEYVETCRAFIAGRGEVWT